MKCPNCHHIVPSENINIQTDIAQCPSCGHIFRVSEAIDSDDNFDIKQPPNGAWIKKRGNRIVIGATTRSAMAFYLVPFMLVWTGGSLGGIYGTQIISGEYDLFMSLFGIPFIIGSIIFWKEALMAVNGKVELTLNKKGGEIFTGIGNFGTIKRFKWKDISKIKEGSGRTRQSEDGEYYITELFLEGNKRIAFGSRLSISRRYYIMKAMKIMISKIQRGNNLA